MPINVTYYDEFGNVILSESNVPIPSDNIKDPNIYNLNGTLSGNRTVDLAKNSLTFQGDQNSVIINGDGSLSVNDSTPSFVDIIIDSGFDNSAAWTINNIYPGTNSGNINSSQLQMLADNTAGYNEWRIASVNTYPVEAKIMELQWEIEMGDIDGSAPQQIDVYVSDKSGVYYLLQSDVQSNVGYSGSLTMTEQAAVSNSPVLRVYMSSPQPTSYKVFINKFILKIKNPAISVKNLQGDSIVATEKISISPTTNLLSTSTSEFGRLFVNSTDKSIYYRPAQSATDYNLLAAAVNGVDGSNCVEFQFNGTQNSAPNNGGFRSSGTSDMTLANILYVDNENVHNVDFSAWFSIIDSSLSYGRTGYIQITKKSSPDVMAIYDISSYFDNTTYKSLGITYIAGAGTFSVGEKYLISYVFNGVDPATAGFITTVDAAALSIALG